MSKSFAALYILAAVLLVGLLSGVYYFSKSVNKLGLPFIQNTSKNNTSSWKTYSDSQNVFTFRYPPDRTIKVADSGFVFVEPVNLPTANPRTPADLCLGCESSIGFGYGTLKGETFKDLVTKEYNEDSKGGVFDKGLSTIVLDKISGYEYQRGPFHAFREIYLPYKDNNYVSISISSSPDEATQKILSTFKFLDQTVNTASWKIYTNDHFGYSFKYPSTWSIQNNDMDNRQNIVRLQFTEQGKQYLMLVGTMGRGGPPMDEIRGDNPTFGDLSFSRRTWIKGGKPFFMVAYPDKPHTVGGGIEFNIPQSNIQLFTETFDQILASFKFN